MGETLVNCVRLDGIQTSLVENCLGVTRSSNSPEFEWIISPKFSAFAKTWGRKMPVIGTPYTRSNHWLWCKGQHAEWFWHRVSRIVGSFQNHHNQAAQGSMNPTKEGEFTLFLAELEVFTEALKVNHRHQLSSVTNALILEGKYQLHSFMFSVSLKTSNVKRHVDFQTNRWW